MPKITFNHVKHTYFNILALLTGVLLAIITLAMVFESYALSIPFYEAGFAAYHVEDIVHISKDDLNRVTEEMVHYLDNRSGDLHVTVTIDGEETPYFNAKEQAHLSDIMNLIRHGRDMLALLKYMLLGLLLMHMSVPENRRFLFFKVTAITSLILLGLLGVMYFADFNWAFIKIHELLFYNDLWMLDPSKDRLLQMMPLGFFMRFTAYWLFTVLAFQVFYYALYHFLSKKMKKRARNNK